MVVDAVVGPRAGQAGFLQESSQNALGFGAGQVRAPAQGAAQLGRARVAAGAGDDVCQVPLVDELEHHRLGDRALEDVGRDDAREVEQRAGRGGDRYVIETREVLRVEETGAVDAHFVPAVI